MKKNIYTPSRTIFTSKPQFVSVLLFSAPVLGSLHQYRTHHTSRSGSFWYYLLAVLLVLAFSATGASAQSVTINPQGSGSANVRTFDAGESLTLTATSISGLSSPFVYAWQTPNAAGTPAGVTFSARNGSTFTITASPSVLNGTTFGIRLEVSGSTSAGPAINSASITIRNHNESPTADAGDNQRVGKGTLVTLDGTGSDDPDGDNSNLSYLWTQTAGPDVTLSSPTAAKPTFTMPGLIPASSPASVTFSLRVRDAAYPATNEDTDEVRIFVRPLFRTTIANQTYSAGNAITDLTLPTALTTSGVTNTYTLSSVPNGLSLNNRILSGTPTGTERTRTFNLTYTATNGDGDTDSLPFNITVTNAEATGVPTISGDLIEDEELTADPSGIADVNGPASPTFSYQWQADGADITGATSATYTLTTDEIDKVITVTVSFTDGGGRQESRTSAATAAVKPLNSTPTTSTLPVTITEDTPYTFAVDDFPFTDADTGESLQQVRIETLPTTGSLTLDGTAVSAMQVIAVADIPNLVYTPATDATADDSFSFSVSDGLAFSMPATATVSITAVNDVPTITSGLTVMPAEDTEHTFAASQFNFADRDTGETLQQLRIDILPATGSLTLDGAAVTAMQVIAAADIPNLTYTPVANANGAVTFSYSVSDGTAFSTASATATITITAVNDSPTISGTPATSVIENSEYSFTPTGADVDVADTLVYAITNKPDWTEFDTTSGVLTGTPDNDDIGDYENIIISVTDGNIVNPVELPAFDIEVINAGRPNVVAVAHPSLAYIPGTIVALDGSGSNDPDGDNANLIYAWTQIDGPTVTLIGADIVIATFITPEGLAIGKSLVFELTVSDTDGFSHNTTITITNTGTLRTDSFNAKAITVFPTSNRTLRVTGLGNEKADVQLFDVLGQLILKTTVSSGHEVNLYGGIKTGIYIVRINTLKGSLNKKIILR